MGDISKCNPAMDESRKGNEGKGEQGQGSGRLLETQCGANKGSEGCSDETPRAQEAGQG
jgi:hypothetical protein